MELKKFNQYSVDVFRCLIIFISKWLLNKRQLWQAMAQLFMFNEDVNAIVIDFFTHYIQKNPGLLEY